MPTLLTLIAPLALLAPLAGCVDLLVPDPQAAGPLQVFDQAWSDVDLYYAHFDVSNVDWNAVRQRDRPRAAAAAGEHVLADVVASMLGELRDPHVTLYTPFHTYQDTSCYRPGSFVAGSLAHYLATTPAAGGRFLFGRLGDVGYVRIPSFEGEGWGGGIDEVLQALGDVRGLVVDVRGNGGGVDGTARAVAQRFVAREGVAEYVRYRSGPGHADFGPPVAITVAPAGRRFEGAVVLLTDRRVFSAAEQFVLFMRVDPQLIVLGDTTAGASGRPLTRELPNGWSFRLSTWMAYTPTFQPYEGTGLPPDRVVRPEPGDVERGVDRVLEAGLAALH